MSNEVFPKLPGLEFGVRDVPTWKTQIKVTPSEREYRASDVTYPVIKKILGFEFLRSDDVWQEMQTLVGFFNRHKGRLDSWLLDDDDDNTAADQVFAVGDGSTVTFQLARSRGGFVQAVDFINGAPVLTLSDWQGDRVRLSAAARTNLFVRSAAFNNGSWTKSAGAAAADVATGPDGGLNAEVFTETTASNTHHVRQVVNVSPDQRYAFMCHAKAGTRSILKLRLSRSDFSSSCSANFNLATGQVGLVNANINGSVISASMVPAGNGYYRCEMVGNADTVADTTLTATIHLMIADVDGPQYVGETTGTMTFADAQLVSGDFAGRYIATAASTVTAPADYTLTASTGKVALATAPAAGVPVRWSGQFYWRCRFERDELEVEKFMADFWRAKQIAVRRVRA